MFKKFIIINLLFIGCGIKAIVNPNVVNESIVQDIGLRLDAYMQALTKLNRFSGAVVVAKGNTVLLNRGYGFASYEFAISNNTQTKFKICSTSKMITAVAILQLQERGLLQVNDTIHKYLPDYPRGDEITIHHLLSHTSGIASCNLPFEMVVCPTPLEQMISFYKSKPLEYDPGSDYKYSNAGYLMLSIIIEKVSGKSYESFIKENILVPLNMNESFFRDHDYAVLKNCAVGYCLNETNNIVNGHYVYENHKGSGGLICTAYDLYIFARALNNGELITKKSLQTMVTPYHTKENYGYGCQINHFMKNKFVEHGGMLSSGFKTNVSVFTNDEIYIVILSNLFSSWVNEARDALAAMMLGLPYDFPSCDVIKLGLATYDDYIGTYDHPSFKSGYKIEKKRNKLYVPQNIELSPVATDQFMILNRNADNIVYKFVRNEKGQVISLCIKGGSPYFEIRCEKN